MSSKHENISAVRFPPTTIQSSVTSLLTDPKRRFSVPTLTLRFITSAVAGDRQFAITFFGQINQFARQAIRPVVPPSRDVRITLAPGLPFATAFVGDAATGPLPWFILNGGLILGPADSVFLIDDNAVDPGNDTVQITMYGKSANVLNPQPQAP